MSNYYDWSVDDLVEVKLDNPDKFNLIVETLTRFGVASIKNDRKILNQTCHIIESEAGKFYIVHFKELFALDGREHTITLSDLKRRNKIISLLEKWETIEVVNPSKIQSFNENEMDNINIIKKEDAHNWIFQKKYDMPLRGKIIKTFLNNLPKK